MNGIERTAAPADTTQWRRVGGAGEQQPMSACPNAIASVGVALYGDLGTQGMVEALFHAALVSDGMRYVRTDSWRTDVTAPTIAGAEELFVSRGVNWHRSVLRLGRSLLHVVIGQGCVTVRAAHEAEGEATVALAAARLAFPESEPAEDQTVPMWLWSAGGELGVRVGSRPVPAPRWAEIEENYAQPTRSALDRLMRGQPPAGAGRLVVWTGEPGTGKTTALRALSWEWRHRYALHYVIDPEALLGRSDYLMEVLSHAEPGQSCATGPGRARGLLLVLEDSGELLMRDAKERVGQGLSRLLNVADGLLGQGLDLLVLITTNESVGGLHSALVRPGRCGAHVEFCRLSAAEAALWLRSKTAQVEEAQRAATLAELYGALRGEQRTHSDGRLGF